MMIQYGFFAYPIQRLHVLKSLFTVKRNYTLLVKLRKSPKIAAKFYQSLMDPSLLSFTTKNLKLET